MKGSVITPLTKIIQGAQEENSEFISRLLEAAERTLGQGDLDNKLLKQLVYENANSTCRAILRGKTKDRTLNDMIRLCNDADPFTHKMTQAVHLAIGAAIQQTPKECFKCKQPGHFARQCPSAPQGPATMQN